MKTLTTIVGSGICGAWFHHGITEVLPDAIDTGWPAVALCVVLLVVYPATWVATVFAWLR